MLVSRPQFAKFARRTQFGALAALSLTTVHHVYEGHIYNMPSRAHHVAVASVVAASLLVVASGPLRSGPATSAGKIALWVFGAVTLLVVAGIGLFESGYGHVAKNALYLGGAPAAVLDTYFPAPMFAVPSNAFFEVTGIFQTVPAFVTGYYFYRLTQALRAL